MGQAAALPQSKGDDQYNAIVRRKPSESRAHHLISIDIYCRYRAHVRPAESENCARCRRCIDRHVPCLIVRASCKVCFCCYARDRMRYLGLYSLLARQMLYQCRGGELRDVTDLLVASLLRVLALDEPVSTVTTMELMPLYQLVSLHLTEYWFGEFSVVGWHARSELWRALVIGLGSRRTMVIYKWSSMKGSWIIDMQSLVRPVEFDEILPMVIGFTRRHDQCTVVPRDVTQCCDAPQLPFIS
jgi:hypothetical protein